MTTDEKTVNEKVQYDINREATKIAASSSSKINKYQYEYFTGKNILPPDQNRIIEQTKITHSPLKNMRKLFKIKKKNKEKHRNRMEKNKLKLCNL